jgi:hypothetical protein
VTEIVSNPDQSAPLVLRTGFVLAGQVVVGGGIRRAVRRRSPLPMAGAHERLQLCVGERPADILELRHIALDRPHVGYRVGDRADHEQSASGESH